ncbi:two-component system cell cycle response regulator CtrA [Planktotalea frisia]|uniref:Cell cycle response regulator CtrA n=1 Tax=Planktotalea frisia TaxID=696762 RepID=A0A1L9NVN5_9RHOB|nr:cell cycle response regulator CtrA [Planktotalea frisia]PZX27705.1 two-component system cell cycle response regulator CtrA [Planktotalea frisia]
MRVLLVEDDPTTSKSIDMMLTHANLNVYTTSFGEEGIDLAKLYDYTAATPKPEFFHGL